MKKKLLFNLQLFAEPNTNVTTDTGLKGEIKTYYEIDIKELFKETKEYLVEFDFKSGCSDVKNIIHFHDNEKGINGYFVFYDLDFKSIDTEYLFENTLIQQLK